MRTRHAIRAVAFTLLFLVPRSAPDAARGEITLLATSDFHGALVQGGKDRVTNRPFGGAVALAQLVRRERSLHPDRTFLLDGGDEMQGTPESNFVTGRSSVAFLNAIGVDAAALGNHEFDWSIDSLVARCGEMHYPLLAANVFDKKTGKRPAWLRPWTIVEHDGARIGVIGFATPETPQVTLPLNVASLRFDRPEGMVQSLMQSVRRQHVDLVVIVCHIGGEQAADGTIRGPVADLARAAHGVDAIVGGHTHQFVAVRAFDVPIVIAASNARALGRLVFDWDGGHARCKSIDLFRAFSDSLDVPAWDPIAALVDSMRRSVRPYVARVLGQAARPLRKPELANLVTDAMRGAMHADVAITNPGGLRRDLEAGPITYG